MCNICKASFSQRTSLRMHKKNHMNPAPRKPAVKVKKEGSTLDRMISSFGRNKTEKSRQARQIKKELVSGPGFIRKIRATVAE